LLGVPVAFALGLLAMMYISVFGTIPFSTGAMQTFFGTEQLAFLAIPLLILSGTLMHVAGIAERIVDFAQVLVGRVPGGLGMADIVASLIFSDTSGSAAGDPGDETARLPCRFCCGPPGCRWDARPHVPASYQPAALCHSHQCFG
jgi:hypothetical protein